MYATWKSYDKVTNMGTDLSALGFKGGTSVGIWISSITDHGHPKVFVGDPPRFTWNGSWYPGGARSVDLNEEFISN